MILMMNCGFLFPFFLVEKDIVYARIFRALASFSTVYLKLCMLNQFVWEVTCGENENYLCECLWESFNCKACIYIYVYIYYIIAQWLDATRAAAKKDKKKKRGLLDAVLRWCAFLRIAWIFKARLRFLHLQRLKEHIYRKCASAFIPDYFYRHCLLWTLIL